MGEVAFNADGAASAVGRLRRSANNNQLNWHDRTGSVAFQVLVGGEIFGLTTSRGGVTSMTIATGVCVDGTQGVTMRLTSAQNSKLVNSAWAVGVTTGMLDTGTIAASTWYHVFLIYRQDTGVVDSICSTTVATPTMPTNYTHYRRIGSFRTDGSSQIIAYTQDGDYFRWAAGPALDVNATNPGTSATTSTVTVPSGVNVHAYFNVGLAPSASGSALYISDLAANDEAASITATPLAQIRAVTNTASGWAIVRTNTTAQIRWRVDSSDGSTVVRIVALAWWDPRGRNS